MIGSWYLFCFLQITGVDHVVFIQKNELDRRDMRLEINAYNESFASRLMIKEHCRYFVSLSSNVSICQMLPARKFYEFSIYISTVKKPECY